MTSSLFIIALYTGHPMKPKTQCALQLEILNKKHIKNSNSDLVGGFNPFQE